MADTNQKSIPLEVKDCLDSLIAVDLNLAISKKYGLIGEAVKKKNVLIGDLFFKNIALKDLVTKIREIFSFDEQKAKNMAIDIAGMRLLVVKDWIGGVEDYIRSLGGDPTEFEKIVNDQITAVKKEKEDWEAELRAEKEKEAELLKDRETPVAKEETYLEPDLEKEKKDSLEIFSSSITDFFSVTESYLIEDYNKLLIEMLAAEKGFALRDQFFKALLENGEKLTSAPFSLDKKPVPATVGNWLKYFIEEKGSGIFDNIILTDFLVKSANAKILNEEEKGAVKKLLQLYRNLKFFPESMPNQTGEGWEIIPSATGATELEKARTVKTPVTNDTGFETQRLIDREAMRVEEANKKITELNTMAAAYPANSLQRKAIEDEIKKIKI
jgi:hypothetical protein